MADDWFSGFDLPGGGDTPINWGGDWTSGQDLPGGGDTGNPTGSPSSFPVGPGQIPAQIYRALLASGALGQGSNAGSIWGNSGGGSGGAGIMSQIGGLPGLLGLLAPLLGGLYASNRTSRATDQTLAGINKAQDQVQAILGGQASPFAPFTAAGQAAMGKAAGMNWTPMAGRFPALGGPASGAVTMRQVLGR